jgi:hypothetical protein
VTTERDTTQQRTAPSFQVTSGVRAVAGYFVVLGVASIGGAVIRVAGGLTGRGASLGYVVLATALGIGVGALLLGRGLLRGRSWAWWVASGVAGLGLITGILAVAVGSFFAGWSGADAALGLVLAGLWAIILAALVLSRRGIGVRDGNLRLQGTRRSGSSAAAAAILVLSVLALTSGAYVLGTRANLAPSDDLVESPSPPPESPEPETVEADLREAYVVEDFDQIAVGDRLSLSTPNLELRNEGCRTGAFRGEAGDWRAAFLFQCEGWGEDHQLFPVRVRNFSEEVVSFRLSRFLLVSQGNLSHQPRTVRDEAQHPEVFLSRSGRIAPRADHEGFIAFRVGRALPKELLYEDRGQVLTLRFPFVPLLHGESRTFRVFPRRAS